MLIECPRCKRRKDIELERKSITEAICGHANVIDSVATCTCGKVLTQSNEFVVVT